MFQLNLDQIIASQIEQPTFLPLLVVSRNQAQQSLLDQISQGETLANLLPAAGVIQQVQNWSEGNQQILNETFQESDFITNFLNRPILGPIDISVEQPVQDHRNFVNQTTGRLRALFVLCFFLPQNGISTVPESHIHPNLRVPVWTQFLEGHFENAVSEAWVEVEREVRRKAIAHDETLNLLVGRNLMTSAFRAQQNPPSAARPGVLTDTTLDRGEQAGIMETFAGVMGAFRNPPNHRRVRFNRQEAFSEILFASRLLFYVDTRP